MKWFTNQTRYLLYKRIFDTAISFIFIIVFLPVFLLCTITIIISMGLPVLFCQERTGLNNRPFKIYKFRTMKPVDYRCLQDDKRITWFGSIIRALHIDELPQLFNILKGDMSFIGPRPLFTKYLEYYTEEEKLRHKVRPGLSCLSQISAVYPAWEEQFKYDIQYVKDFSFKLDIIIFFRTILKVFKPSREIYKGMVVRPGFDVYRQGQKRPGSQENNKE